MEYFQLICLFCFIVIFQTNKGELIPQEQLHNESTCDLLNVNVNCSADEIIAVDSIYFYYKATCETVCCLFNDFDSTHSSLSVDSNSILYVRRVCSGRNTCTLDLQGTRLFASVGVHEPSYVLLQYYCIHSSKWTSICSSTSLTSAGEPLYLTSKDYPSITTGDSTCSCSLEVYSCTSTINMFLLDSELYYDTASCEQSLDIVDERNTSLKEIKCKSYYTNEIDKTNFKTNYLKIDFKDDSTQNQEGQFFLGFTVSENNATFQLSCSYELQSFCRDCEDRSGLLHGYVNPVENNNTKHGSLAEVVCDNGYETDNTTVTCLETGYWESVTCSPKDCGQVPEISNAIVSLNDDQNTKYGAFAYVTCAEGSETPNGTITCLASEEWSLVSCRLKDCGHLYRLENGDITLAPENLTTFGAVALVKCDIGFNKSASSIRCLSSGEWEAVKCTIIECSIPPTIEHGSITLLKASVTEYSSLAIVSCQNGFHTVTPLIACKETGFWERSSCEQDDDDRLTLIVVVTILSTILFVVGITAGCYIFFQHRKKLRKKKEPSQENEYQVVFKENEQSQYSGIALENRGVDG